MPLSSSSSQVLVIDSYTAGAPTRVVIDGGPVLGSGTLEETLIFDVTDPFRGGIAF